MTLQTAYSEGIRPGIRTEAGNQDIKKMPSIAPTDGCFHSDSVAGIMRIPGLARAAD
jgi:hypothetical protein